MKTRETIINVIEYINTEGYDNSQWQVTTKEVYAQSYYGATNLKKVLKPHIAVWIPEDEISSWVLVAPWDETIITQDGDTIAIFYF